MAHTVAKQHDQAVDCARRAVERQPGDADAHLYLAFAEMFAGHAEQACEAMRTALRLDPQYVNGPYLNILGMACFCASRYDEAIAAFEKNIARGGPLAPPAIAFRAASYSAAGRREEARATALNFYPGFTLTGFRVAYLFKQREITERLVQALRTSGLPE